VTPDTKRSRHRCPDLEPRVGEDQGAVLGSTSLVQGAGIDVSDVSLRLDLPVMVAATVVLVPIIWNGFVIRRWEGVVFVGFYAAYVTYLVLDANGSNAPSASVRSATMASALWVLSARDTSIAGVPAEQPRDHRRAAGCLHCSAKANRHGPNRDAARSRSSHVR
jgi:cation:H+ antiporter